MLRGGDIKAKLKRGAKAVLTSTSMNRSVRNDTRIVTYHSIGDRDHEMNVEPARFREHMAWLRDHRNVITLEEAAAGAPGVSITLDDGYRDNLTNAAPILNGYAMPATVFVVAGKLGGWLAHDIESESARLLNESELRELASDGIAIGGHSMTHPHLADLPPAEQTYEIGQCKLRLEQILQDPVIHFSYPYGTQRDFNDVTREFVSAAGYRLAVSNRFGPVETGADPFSLRRINIDASDTLDTFVAKVEGRLDGLALMEWRLGLAARATINRLLQTS